MLNILLLIVTVLLLGIVAVALHYLSPHYGKSLALIYVSGMAAVLVFAYPFTFHVEPVPELVFTIGADFYIPVILLCVLVFYVVDGTAAARMVIVGIIMMNMLVMTIFVFINLYAGLPDNANAVPAELLAYFEFDFIGAVISTLAFTLDLIVVAVAYQGIRNYLPALPPAIAPGVALLAALWTDSIVFNLLLNPVGNSNSLIELLPGDIASKTISGLVLWLPAAFYLTRIAPRFPEFASSNRRSMFDIIPVSFLRNHKLLDSLRVELHESRLNYQQMVEHLQEAIWLANADEQYAYFISPAFEMLTGISPADYYLSPARFEAMVHPDDRGECGRLLCFAEKSDDIEFRIVIENNKIRWLRQRSFPIYDDSGTLVRRIGIIEDRTAQHEIGQQEVKLVVEREKVLLLNELISEARHDLKNPLGSMGLKVDLIQRLDDPERQAKHLNDLKTLTMRLAGMIDQAFALSQVEGITATKTENHPINAICQEVLTTRQLQADEKGITLVFEPGTDDTHLIHCNRRELLKAISILVDNALQYTPTGGTITVSTNYNQDDIYVQVTDTGIGIPEDDVPLIFRQSYRGSNVSTDTGTGVGLTLMKRIVEMHHGKVDVDSIEDTGSTFTIRLPRR